MCNSIEYKSETFFYRDQQNVKLFTKKWLPCDESRIKGIIQVAHGMGETADYYREFSANMVKLGFAVYINEARGHGRTAGNINAPSYEESAGYMGEDGISWMVEDIRLLTDIIKIENPGLPNFLLGHSLGSVLAQIYAYKYGSKVNGIIYSGTTGPIDGRKIEKLIEVVEEEVAEVGRKGKSVKTADYFFRHYNDKFQPAKTDYDWLTSDFTMLEDTLSSPYAAIDYKVGYYEDFIDALKNLHREEFIKKIPEDLSILSISGNDDPFGNYGESIKTLFQTYKKFGIKDITYKIYKNGRHEMLREVNRNEVMRDLYNWLCSHI